MGRKLDKIRDHSLLLAIYIEEVDRAPRYAVLAN